ncbi:MAG: thymidylate synthase (FAD) [Candidatus Puniceispirillum sp.]|nr:thymidylate synthase (FAD) [Candidatus Pelagibacter sp.]MBA4283415.1 thymidylate synthase (FAD) [Candidatus Puniceispirillum sp.]
MNQGTTTNTAVDHNEETFVTKRATVPALENILGEAHSILDHGFIRVVDYMGDDSAIVQAARVSYGKGTKQTNEDRGLLRYLMRHWHSTPFEMCEMKFHIKLPFFVARQWIRHRTANVNEYSARYSIMDKEFYLPSIEDICKQSVINKQGRSEPLSPEQAEVILNVLRDDAERCYSNYENMLNEDNRHEDHPGIARELARVNLTLNFYTQWYWKIDLHNLLHFIRLRADAHAQYEIRVYAEKLAEIVKLWVPHTFEAFEDYRQNGVHLSAQALELVKKRLSGETVDETNCGMSKREWSELLQTLGVTKL